MNITLKREAQCAECGATLAAGTQARWYRNGKTYGLACHEQRPVGARRSRRPRDRSAGALRSHYDRRGVYAVDGTYLGTAGPRCEDAPCCGCCS